MHISFISFALIIFYLIFYYIINLWLLLLLWNCRFTINFLGKKILFFLIIIFITKLFGIINTSFCFKWIFKVTVIIIGKVLGYRISRYNFVLFNRFLVLLKGLILFCLALSLKLCRFYLIFEEKIILLNTWRLGICWYWACARL